MHWFDQWKLQGQPVLEQEGTIRCRSRREASNWGHWCLLSMVFVYVIIWWNTVYQALPLSFHADELLTVIKIGPSLGGRPSACVSKLWCHGICRGRLEGSRRWVDLIEQTQSDIEKQTWHFCVHTATPLSLHCTLTTPNAFAVAFD